MLLPVLCFLASRVHSLLYTHFRSRVQPVCDATLFRTHTWRDLADRGRVPTVALVTVGALDKNGAVAETLGEHFSSDVVQSHAAACGETQT